MNYVEPIRDAGRVNDIRNYLKKDNKRNYIMFLIGTNTGLRISDILDLKVKDVKNKQFIVLKEIKTRKQQKIKLNKLLKRELREYCIDKDLDEYLIKSREGTNTPLSRDMAYKILSEVGAMFNLSNIGTHTLRKTFGYHFYNQTKDVALLQKLFNHASPSITLRYIGIEQENMNIAMDNFSI